MKLGVFRPIFFILDINNFVMIKFIKATKDKFTKKEYKVGQKVDLGKGRNSAAVKRGLAEFVEDTETEKKQVKTVSKKKISATSKKSDNK